MKVAAAKEDAAVQEGIQRASHDSVLEDLGLEKGLGFFHFHGSPIGHCFHGGQEAFVIFL